MITNSIKNILKINIYFYYIDIKYMKNCLYNIDIDVKNNSAANRGNLCYCLILGIG